LSGGNIIFSSAPAGAATFFGVVLAGADYVNAGANFPDGTLAAPSITFDQDNDTGYYRSGSGSVSFAANGVAAGTWSSAGVTAPALIPTGSSVPANGVYLPSTNSVAISTNGTGRLFVDASGRVLVGLSTARATFLNGTVAPKLQIESTGADAALSIVRPGASPRLILGTTGSASIGDNTLISAAATLGSIEFVGTDGTNISSPGAFIRSFAEGTPASGSIPASLTFSTTANAASAPTERMRIDSSGRVGIGTTSPSTAWTQTNQSTATVAAGVALFDSGGTVRGQVGLAGAGTGSSANQLWLNGSSELLLNTGGNERSRIDSSGRLLIGTSSNSGGNVVQIQGPTSTAAASVGSLSLRSGYTPISNFSTDEIARIDFQVLDGGVCARIQGYTNGATVGTNDYPGALLFSTTADGASSPTERMRIDSSVRMLVGTTNTSPATSDVVGALISNAGEAQFSRDGGGALAVNRKTDDGTLVALYQAGALEGTISVSGTTVSYNGAHLSRWSQLPGGAEREEILRGTVLSNIDEMCDWGEEDNEQLNRMQVSDVEGDPNVSGVFQAWDDDDDTYTDDFYCAMTGDFIIRIAEGVTVQRGDLLMSAGDGTAKPQDDDIIRSKTIAKVTSTHVTCTYDDGSYCVPCVLMAC
jgi:hypothetical protein